MSKIVASCSTKVLVHDLDNSKSTNYNTATTGGTGLQPSLTFSAAHHLQGKINAVAWSHNN